MFVALSPIGRADSLGHGTVSVLHVKSADHDVAIRDVWVYRPAVPDSKNLPVVYFLHGLPGKASDFFTAGGAHVLDALFAAGTPPFVLAAPTGIGYAHYDTEWADSHDRRDLLETYILKNVIPAVEGANRRDAKHRIIAGFSMGGYGAANLAIRNPTVFSAAACFAGYFKIDDPSNVFANIPLLRIANDPELLVPYSHGVRFWLGVGASDLEPVVQGQAQHFAKLAGTRVPPHDLVIAPGTHSWSFVMAHVKDMANFVAYVA